MSVELMPFSHHFLCHPLLPSVFLSIRVFSNESILPIRWPKCWSFSISLYNEYSRLISFGIDWFDLAVQGILKSLQEHQLFGAQPSLWSNLHLNMTIGKTIALTIQTFVTKVMSLLCNMLYRFMIAFLPRNKCLLMVAVIVCSDFGDQENKIFQFFSPSICHEVVGPDATIFISLMLNFKPGFFTLLFYPHWEAL